MALHPFSAILKLFETFAVRLTERVSCCLLEAPPKQTGCVL